MRILMLTNFYPPHHLGGFEECCAEVADALQRRGHAVGVLTSRRRTRDVAGGESPCSPPVYRRLYPEVDLRPFRAGIGFFIGRRRRLRRNLARFSETLAAFRPDIVMVWGMWNLSRRLLLLAEPRARPKVVYYLCDYWPTLPGAYTLYWQERARHRATRLLKRGLGHLAAWVDRREEPPPSLNWEHAICGSRAVRERLVAAGFALASASVIHPGIDATPFLEAGAAREPHQGPLRVGYVGRLVPEKGVHVAIEALAALVRDGQRVTLAVTGRGDSGYRRELRGMSTRLGVSHLVSFHDVLPRADIPWVMTGLDVLAVPSLWAEPLGRILEEGMAAGLVVVGTAVGGTPEIVEDGANGLLCPPGDAEALARCIARVIGDPGLANRLRQAARATIETRFTLARMLDQMERYLHTVLEQDDSYRREPRRISASTMAGSRVSPRTHR